MDIVLKNCRLLGNENDMSSSSRKHRSSKCLCGISGRVIERVIEINKNGVFVGCTKSGCWLLSARLLTRTMVRLSMSEI